jgi:hypothetical protein
MPVGIEGNLDAGVAVVAEKLIRGENTRLTPMDEIITSSA